MTRLRLWIFRLIAIAGVPLLLLGLLEGGLRIIGFGTPSTFTVPCEVQGQKGYCDNPRFGWLFFPPAIAREPRPFFIPSPKPSDAYRIVVFGGSAAEGDPDPSYGFSRILEVMLKNRYPDAKFEVINAAMTAINSHVVYQIAKDMARHQPDLFILYLGNNEVVGPYGAGTVFSPLSPSLAFIRMGIFLKSTKIGQLMEKTIAFASGNKKNMGTWRGMEMFLNNRVRRDDPGLRKVHGHFKKNLQDIISLADGIGARTMISTVATNLRDNAPFASLHSPRLTPPEKEKWNGIYTSAIEFEEKNQIPEARQAYLEALELDDQFADLQYRLARIHLRSGEMEKARHFYILSRDLDTLRFRADSSINEVIRTVAKENKDIGVQLIDPVQIYETHSKNGIPGNDLFYEHAHMVFEGNYLIARELFNHIEKFLPAGILNSESNTGPLSQNEIARRLAFTGYDQYRLASEMLWRTRRPPFTNQLDHGEQDRMRQQTVNDLSIFTKLEGLRKGAAQYEHAIKRWPSDPWLYYNFAFLLQEGKNPAGAIPLLKKFIGMLPHYYPAYERLASALIQEGNFQEAIDQTEISLNIMPTYYQASQTKALALAKAGNFAESILIYEKIAQVSPDLALEAYNQMSKILITQGKWSEAEDRLKRAVKVNAETRQKNIPDIHANLGHTLKQLGKTQEAFQTLRQAVDGYREELNKTPNSSTLHAAIGNTLVELGDFPQATQHFQKAVDLEPGAFENHFYLIKGLEAQGHRDQAVRAAQTAIRTLEQMGQRNNASRLKAYLQSFFPQTPKK